MTARPGVGAGRLELPDLAIGDPSARGPIAAVEGPGPTLAAERVEPDARAGTAARPAPLLVATGLTKRYGALTVLDGVDLSIEPATLVAVAGRNGAGKSTLLACLAGTVRHDGRVLLEGRPLGRATQGRVAYLPQRLRLPSGATGREVLRLFAASAAGRPDRVPLPEGFLPDLDKSIGHLSGGQAQRIGLAAVLRGAPGLVLLDEPFANLDDDAREQAHALLRAHRDAGASVVVASPVAGDRRLLIDRLLAVGSGGITFDGRPDEADAAVMDGFDR
jgi:ABC-type multidrug transport system ATPase subunit